MSEEATVALSPAVQEAEPPAPAPTPTVTHYQEIAERVSAALDELLALIPNFVESHPAMRGFVRTHQSVPEDFVATTIAAVEAIPELQGTGCFDAKDARDALQFIGAFRSVADKMQASATNLQFTIDARRAEVNKRSAADLRDREIGRPQPAEHDRRNLRRQPETRPRQDGYRSQKEGDDPGDPRPDHSRPHCRRVQQSNPLGKKD